MKYRRYLSTIYICVQSNICLLTCQFNGYLFKYLTKIFAINIIVTLSVVYISINIQYEKGLNTALLVFTKGGMHD